MQNSQLSVLKNKKEGEGKHIDFAFLSLNTPQDNKINCQEVVFIYGLLFEK